jgi:VWFA-related protein
MSLCALEQIAAATRGVAGRKNILWVGDGFPSMKTLSQASSTVDRVQETIRRVSRHMLEARVTLYVIGPTLKPNVLTHVESEDDAAMADVASGGRVPEGDVQFSGLALETGGRAYSGRNDMTREIEESVASGLNYYTISYVPTTKSDNRRSCARFEL